MRHYAQRLPIVLLWLMLLAACRPPILSTPRVKIVISSSGMYRVTAAALEAIGARIGSIDPATLRLFQDDQEIAVRVHGSGGSMTLDFFGQASDSPYTAFNVYWLTWGGPAGKRMKEERPHSSGGTVNRSFDYRMHVTRPSLFIPQPGDLPKSWFWQVLTAPVTSTIPITLSQPVSAQAALSVNVFGSSQDSAIPDHHLRVSFNEVRIADETWDGQGERAINATIPANAIREGENTLRLAAPGDTKAPVDIVLLSSIDITFTRRLVVGPDAIEFRDGRGSYQVQGLDRKAVELLDISDPNHPVYLIETSTDTSSRAVSGSESNEHRWLALPSSGYRMPDGIVPMPRTDVRERARQADYVIITHPDFVQVLQPLVQWRARNGRQVALATTSEIYDEFNYGKESPLALRAFLDYVKPRFALLVGKASYDYRDYHQGPNKNLVPTFLVETPHLNQAASDDWFTSSSLPYPSFAVGRIPAKTRDQVARYVAKLIAYESGSQDADWRTRATFVADDKDQTFASLSDALVAKTEGRVRADKVYLAMYQGDIESTRAEIVSKWNQGTLLLTYVGHGSLDTWAEGPLFGSENVGDIQNGERLPILMTPTCLDGFFYHPLKDSLAEELLFSKHGGIIAGVVPTGLSTTDAQGDLMRALFSEIFQKSKPTLGEALADAKRKLDFSLWDNSEVSQTFVLLGDPALQLPGF